MTLGAFQDLFLGKPKGIDAKWLAARARCSLPTVYRKIRALEAAGAVFAEAKTPRKKTGPTPRKFILAKGARV